MMTPAIMNAPLNIDIVQVLLHMLNLVILVGGLTLILYRPVTKFLEERRRGIEEEERRCAEERASAEALREEYERKCREADEVIEERAREAERVMAERAGKYMDAARARADEILKSAEEEAESRKAHILEAAQTEIGELVITAAQKLINENASPEGDRALYDEFIRTASDESAEDGK